MPSVSRARLGALALVTLVLSGRALLTLPVYLAADRLALGVVAIVAVVYRRALSSRLSA
jgi:hypothetical protein